LNRHTITGQGPISYGVLIYDGYTGTTIKNGYISGFGAGIISRGDYGHFTNLIITANGDFGAASTVIGMDIRQGENNRITDNNINIVNTGWHGHSWGIKIIQNSNSILTNNIVTSNGNGIFLSQTSDSILTSNTANSNWYYGISLSSSDGNTLIGNTANSNWYYGISLSSSSNNEIRGNTYNNNGVYQSPPGMFVGEGISVTGGSGNTIIQNNLDSNKLIGIRLKSTSSNSILGNTLSNNGYTNLGSGAIFLESSSDNEITGNEACGNLLRDLLCSGSGNTGNFGEQNTFETFACDGNLINYVGCLLI